MRASKPPSGLLRSLIDACSPREDDHDGSRRVSLLSLLGALLSALLTTPSLHSGFPGGGGDDFDPAAFIAERKKKNLRYILIAFAVLAAIGGGLVFLGTGDAGKTVEETSSRDKEEAEQMRKLGPPTWKDMAMKEVKITSDPPGAVVAINGELQFEGLPPDKAFERPDSELVARTTPGKFRIIEGTTNTISLFHPDHPPMHDPVPPDADASAGFTYTLKPHGDDPEYGVLAFGLHDEELHGSKLWLDGVRRGELPTKIDRVLLGATHHVFVEPNQDRVGPFTGVVTTMAAETGVLVSMLPLTYVDREADIDVDAAPRKVETQVFVNDERQLENKKIFTLRQRSKGELVTFKITNPAYESWIFSVHTTQAGTYQLKPILKKKPVGKAQLVFKFPEDGTGKFWYPCIKAPGRSPKCRNADNRDFPFIVDSVEWTVTGWEQVGGHTHDKRHPKGDLPTITLEPNRSYEVFFDFSGDELKVVMPKEPPEWHPPEDCPPGDAECKKCKKEGGTDCVKCPEEDKVCLKCQKDNQPDCVKNALARQAEAEAP